MAKFSDFVPEVLAAAPDCPNPTIIRTVRQAVRDLCEKADCYRFTIDNQGVGINVNDIEIDVPVGTSLHKVIKLTLGKTNLEASSVTLENDRDPEWRTRVGTPKYYLRSTEELNNIIISPKAEKAFSSPGLIGEVALKPTLTATEVSDVFIDRYYQTIVDGAIFKLLTIASAPWYNPQQGSQHGAMFLTGIAQASSQANNDNTPKRRIVSYGGL